MMPMTTHSIIISEKLYDGFSKKCCGGTLVDHTNVCCGDDQHGTSYPYSDGHHCCGIDYINNDTSLCCTSDTGHQKVILLMCLISYLNSAGCFFILDFLWHIFFLNINLIYYFIYLTEIADSWWLWVVFLNINVSEENHSYLVINQTMCFIVLIYFKVENNTGWKFSWQNQKILEIYTLTKLMSWSSLK